MWKGKAESATKVLYISQFINFSLHSMDMGLFFMPLIGECWEPISHRNLKAIVVSKSQLGVD